MKISKAAIVLSIAIALLAVVQSGAGLFYQDGGQPFAFTTLHGQTVQMYGQGIYHFETAFKAPIQRGTDAVTLFVCVPLLIIVSVLYRRGSLRGAIFLTGLLSFFLYNAASLVFGAAYNLLFPVYLAYFSASLYAFLLAFQSVDLPALPARLSPNAPRLGMALLLFAAGAGLLFAWLPDILGGLAQGWVPTIGSSTTEITYGIDLGVIVPASILAGVLLLRRAPLGYLLGAILVNMLIVIGVVVAAQTTAQALSGIALGVGEFIGKAGSFILLSLIAIGLMVRFMRSISEPAQATLREARKTLPQS